jgi:hypothetical protein
MRKIFCQPFIRVHLALYTLIAQPVYAINEYFFVYQLKKAGLLSPARCCCTKVAAAREYGSVEYVFRANTHRTFFPRGT